MLKIKIFGTLSSIGSWSTLWLGLLVLIGWYANSSALIQVHPSFAPMQYNTALAFLLVGLSLLMVKRNKFNTSRVVSTVFGLIGLITLVEYIFGINVGIDELFMDHAIVTQTSHPGRMAPNTALCFVLTSLAILLTTRSIRQIQIAGVLGSLVFGLGLVAFVGYLIGMEETYGWGRLTHMAIHTSLGFMIVGFSLTAFIWIKERDSYRNDKKSSPWLVGYAAALAITILFIDLDLPLGVAAGISYVFLVLFGWFIPQKKAILILAIVATILTILGFLLSSSGVATWMVVVNRAFSLIAIWLVAILLYHIKGKENELINANAELDQRAVQTQAKNRELEQFAYIASHDLQEPLRTVSSFTQLLENDYKDKFDEVGRKSLEYIRMASERMRNLIKGLLDYSRIGQDRELVEVSCNKLLMEIQEDLSSRITETSTTFEIDELPSLMAYETELRLLFQNLILNAIKFMEPDVAPNVKISAKPVGDSWHFSVSDNGIGISKEHLERIFSIFQRLHERGKYDGTGIGLAHCRKIAELHAGKIWVESELGHGSTFYFTIPKQIT